MEKIRPGKFYEVAFKICPVLALIFSLLVTITTLYLNEGLSLIFIFISIQVYLNWYSICKISSNARTMRDNYTKNDNIASVAIRITQEEDSGTKLKYWYCEYCTCYTYRPTQHCRACKKCFHYRDHHCFFIGGCILQLNMGNFILICFYTSLACCYSSTIIGPHIYDSLSEIIGEKSSYINIFLNFCFPVAFARFLITGQGTCLFLIILFNSLISVSIVCFLYGSWKLFCCLSGKQRYYPHVARRVELKEIFGSYGIWNFIFPYNGLLGLGDLNGKYSGDGVK
ncbi:probable protein S-acyltransferase 14 [Fopius arisanus]|nr:PREDICTED: probable protein S-acyltransferase 14 [Fopius arisanus]XP_011297050.1 PREDICTED: probable protein S-acyltransferase 14 [Fopius arisanus]XP_011297051.1 PREDICTED: probable protein S-acyltransferase 14 [Fopius arisanus]